jgi:hypothetical protein
MMQLTHAKESDNFRSGSAIRGGAREFKTLLTGEEGSPDNYKLSFVHQTGELNIPRHKHNFDQIRMCLEGDRQNYGKNKWIEPGELVYFPEGTPYGPEQSSSQRLSITLQFGGASGSGYIGMKRIHAAIDTMKAFGTFEGGVFTRTDELTPGEKRNQDSYEAIWEHVNKRKLAYPKPRYDEPIRIKPQNFEWQSRPGEPGVATKLLGMFSERGSELSMLRLDGGAASRLAPFGGIRIGFVVQGDGAVNGRAVYKHSAFSLAPAEDCSLAAGAGMQLLMIALPRIESRAAQAA